MHKKGSDAERGNKISRLQFLRLLGAGAIGYFAYRAGFINNNNLFGNATAATTAAGGRNAMQQGHAATGSSSSLAAAQRLDEDGILMMATPKPGGYSYRFDTTQDPTHDIRLDIHDTGEFEIKQEGTVKLIRFMSHKPGTGGADNTARLHIFTENKADEGDQKYNWINGAPQMGWLTKPNDLKNGEWTFICRPNRILDYTDAITAKLGGGNHSIKALQKYDASTWNVHWSYDASTNNAVNFEFIHPEYENDHTVKLYNTYKPLGDRWFGCKVVSMVRPDQSARDIITYFNEDPIDLNTGKPKNDGWKKYFEFTHTGQGDQYNIPHTWGGAKNTWRNDQLTSIDVAYMNHREIIALNNNGNNMA
jgi:hypothetical protein